MGLDSVQIIVDTERCFGIEIENSAAEKMRTVGDLVDHVWNAIESKESKACLTQILFFRLRKFFVQNLSITPSQFKPFTHFSDLGRKEEFDRLLPQLQSELQLKLPTIFTRGRILIFIKLNSDTVLDLIDGIIYKNLDELKGTYGLSKESVHSVIASITHEIVGAPRKDIIPTAKFVDDLGVD